MKIHFDDPSLALMTVSIYGGGQQQTFFSVIEIQLCSLLARQQLDIARKRVFSFFWKKNPKKTRKKFAITKTFINGEIFEM